MSGKEYMHRGGGGGGGGGRGRGRGIMDDNGGYNMYHGGGHHQGGHHHGHHHGGMGEHRREMRRPNEPSTDHLVSQMIKMNPYGGAGGGGSFPKPAPSADGWSDGENKIKDISLSPRAHEFVPKSTLNVTAQEFVPRRIARNTSSWAYEQQQQQQQQVVSTAIFDVNAILSQTIGTLTYSPGMFDVTANNLASTLNTNVSDKATLEIVADTIVETSLKETNFRYTGARLCHYLCSLITNPIEGKTFRDVLLDKCCQEHKQTEEVMKTNVVRVRSFTMFLAELFLQLSVFKGDVQERISFLGDVIMELLITLSSQRDKENLKSIAQTLKLSGSVLEYEEKKKKENATPLMDKVMELVVEISKDESVEKHIAAMMANLPELRKANWGLGSGSEPPPPAPIPTLQPPPQPQQPPQHHHQQQQHHHQQHHHQPYHSHHNYNKRQYKNNHHNNHYDPYAAQGEVDEGIFYAPDGQELTYGEYEFMNAQLENAELEAATEGDMPADVEAAFEEFLGSQNKWW